MLERIRRAVRRLRRPFSRRGLVLVYHSVAEVRSDPWALHVSPQHFAEQMEVIRAWGTPLPLRDLARAAEARTLPRRAIAVTFDDGYANNLHRAGPALERWEIPATVFVTTGFVDQTEEAWWDVLDRVLLQTDQVPPRLSLQLNGVEHEWQMDGAERYSEVEARRDANWRAWGDAPTPRQHAYRAIWKLLHPQDGAVQTRAVSTLLAQSGSRSQARETHRFLSHAELLELGRNPAVEIGAHTVTHPALAPLPPKLQREEIVRSKSMLEDWLGARVRNFAYPFGKTHDVSAETVSVVRDSGFACACVNFPGGVAHGTDVFQLPRFHVDDWSGDEFARHLDRWFRS